MRLFMSSTIKYTPFLKKCKEQNSGLPHFLEKFFLLPSKTSGQRTAGAADYTKIPGSLYLFFIKTEYITIINNIQQPERTLYYEWQAQLAGST